MQFWPIDSFLSDSRSQIELKNKVITNITDKWQDECKRMRDNCRKVKTSEDE